jgi:predicted porin
MKRYLVGLAALAPLAGLVHAEPSVSIYGTVDGGLRYQTNADARGGSKLSMGSNGYYSSNKLDFSGSEQLGENTTVKFVLESGFNLGTGALDNTDGTLFQRQAYIQLSHPLGTVSLGRQYTISHDFLLIYDPFGFHYTPLIPLTKASSGTRFNNDIKYVGQAGPFRLELENAFGENAGSTSKGAARGIGLNYHAGPLVLGGSYNHRSIASGGTFLDDDYWLVGAAWIRGDLKVSGGTMSETLKNPAPAGDAVTRNSFGGVSYRLTPTYTVTAGYYQTDAKSDKARRRGMLIAGIDYALSKRTRLYAEFDYTRFRNAVVSVLNTVGVPNQKAGTVGINHQF